MGFASDLHVAMWLNPHFAFALCSSEWYIKLFDGSSCSRCFRILCSYLVNLFSSCDNIYAAVPLCVFLSESAGFHCDQTPQLLILLSYLQPKTSKTATEVFGLIENLPTPVQQLHVEDTNDPFRYSSVQLNTVIFFPNSGLYWSEVRGRHTFVLKWL